MKYDAFISYRRENGFFLAEVIRDHLKRHGLSSFLDIEELSAGVFDSKILGAIQEAPNFIVLLTEGALDRCSDEQDWVRKEIIEAVRLGKTIIPVMYGGFSWPREWPEGMPEEVKSLKVYQAVPGTREYLPAMIGKIISYMSGCQLNDAGVLHVATSNLTVVDSFMQGSDFQSVFSDYGFSVEKIAYKWSDKILTDMSAGIVDVAVYNKESCLAYNERHDEKIHILCDACSSMGGRNFYILASNSGRWQDVTLSQFKESLDGNTMIAVSKSSDMFKNLLYILDMTETELMERGVKVMDYHSDQGLELFNFLPDLLVIAGQDIRYLAQQNGNFHEIISYDDFPQEKKDFFYRNSINSILISPSALAKLEKYDLNEIRMDLMMNFYRSMLNQEARQRIRARLSQQLGVICDDRQKQEYIVDNILFETYRML